MAAELRKAQKAKDHKGKTEAENNKKTYGEILRKTPQSTQDRGKR